MDEGITIAIIYLSHQLNVAFNPIPYGGGQYRPPPPAVNRPCSVEKLRIFKNEWSTVGKCIGYTYSFCKHYFRKHCQYKTGPIFWVKLIGVGHGEDQVKISFKISTSLARFEVTGANTNKNVLRFSYLKLIFVCNSLIFPRILTLFPMGWRQYRPPQP